MSTRFFRVGGQRQRTCIFGCAIAIVVIWIYIVAQLATSDPAVEDMPSTISHAFPETLAMDSIIAVPPLFARESAPDTPELIDPFWPLARAQLGDVSMVMDSSSMYSAFDDITFYGTLRRKQRLLGLIGNSRGISSLVGTGDSLRGGIVETVAEDGITVRIAGGTCLLERRP